MLLMMMVLTDDQSELVEKLYKDYYGLFYSIAYNVLKSKQEAEDAVHTSFEKISKKIEKISQLSCPQRRSYCVVLVENHSISMLRASGKVEYVSTIDETIGEGAVDPEEILVRIVEEEELKRVFRMLPDEERELLRLHYYDNWSYKQIAEVYGISVEAAKKRGQRAIGTLRSMIDRNDVKGI